VIGILAKINGIKIATPFPMNVIDFLYFEVFKPRV
jgi:hypothetical protein